VIGLKRPWTYVLFAILLLGFIAFQVPAWWASDYNFFGSDDIWFGRYTHAAWVETHNVFSVLGAAFYTAGHVWANWQGNFTAVVMFSLNPAVFTDWGMHNQLGPWVVMFFLMIGVTIFIKTLFKNYFDTPWELYYSLVIICGIVFTQLVPSYRSAYLWWAAAINYGAFLGIFLLGVAAVLKYFRCTSRFKPMWFIFALLLGCFVAGGMYVFHTFVMAAFVVAVIIKEFIYHNRKGRILYFIMIPFTILAFVNIFAPGNVNRMASTAAEAERNPVMAVIKSIGYAFFETGVSFTTGDGSAGSAPNGFNFAFLSILVLAFVVAWQVAKPVKLQFRQPGTVIALSFIVYASYYTPYIYAVGWDVKPRVFDCGYYIWFLFMIFDAFYLMVWLKPKLVLYYKKNRKLFVANIFGGAYKLVGMVSPVLLIGVFLLGYFNMNTYVNGYLGFKPGAIANYEALTKAYTANGVEFGGRTLPEVNIDFIQEMKRNLLGYTVTIENGTTEDGTEVPGVYNNPEPPSEVIEKCITIEDFADSYFQENCQPLLDETRTALLEDTRENDKLLTAHVDLCPLPGYGYNLYAQTYWNKDSVSAFFPNETTNSWWLDNPVGFDSSYYSSQETRCQGQEHLNA